MDRLAAARAGQVGQLVRLPSGHPQVAADDLGDLSAFAHLLTVGDTGGSRRQEVAAVLRHVGRAAVVEHGRVLVEVAAVLGFVVVYSTARPRRPSTPADRAPPQTEPHLTAEDGGQDRGTWPVIVLIRAVARPPSGEPGRRGLILGPMPSPKAALSHLPRTRR